MSGAPVPSACDDASVGSLDSHWLVLDAGDCHAGPQPSEVSLPSDVEIVQPEDYEDVIWVRSDGESDEDEESSADTSASIARPAQSPAAAAVLSPRDPLPCPPPEPTAALLAISRLDMSSSSGAIEECAGHQRSTSCQWASALVAFPGLVGAFCLGRVAVDRAAAAARSPGDAVAAGGATVRVIVQNCGAAAWSPGTALRLVAGHGFGFGGLDIGELPAGCSAEIVLDLSFAPEPVGSCTGARSGWVLEDAHGRPFGPLLHFEAVWT